MLTENTECSTLQRRRDPQGNTTHREGSEKLAIYTRLKQQQNTPLAQNKVWRFLNQSRQKRVGLVGKEISHCSDHNEEPTGPSASPCFPACHPRHDVSQTAHGPTTSAAWEPPQQTHHALKSHESDFEAPTNNTKTGGHSKPHQSAAGARHVCDDADLSSATCGASDGRRSKIVHTSRGSTGAALSWRKNLWPISSAYTTILLKLSMVRPPVLA